MFQLRQDYELQKRKKKEHRPWKEVARYFFYIVSMIASIACPCFLLNLMAKGEEEWVNNRI